MTRLHLSLVAALLALGCAPVPPVQPTQSAASDASTASPQPAGTEAPAAAASLTGVLHDEFDQPLADVAVEAWADGKVVLSTKSGADGGYQMSLAPGAYRVAASKPGFGRREQAVTVAGATTLDFGGWQGALINPFHLSSHPEISRVSVEEQGPSGPLALTVHLSEPLTKVSQENFLSRLELRARSDVPFLRPAEVGISELRMATEWDEAGQSVTLRYDQPYLASGTEAVPYTLRLTQIEKDTRDPVTRENEWEDMHVTDAEGLPLGRNRAAFAFLMPQLTPFPASLLTDKTYGYSPQIRRWNLTHSSSFTFEAAKDTTGPGVTSVRVDVNKVLSGTASDVMTLRFTEPMRVVKSLEQLQYTRLDEDKPLRDTFVVNVSKDEDGRNPQPLGAVYKINRFRFSKTDPNVVYAYFAPHAFKDMKWVEVTLGDEARDPANNKPAGDKLQISGSVTSAEE